MPVELSAPPPIRYEAVNHVAISRLAIRSRLDSSENPIDLPVCLLDFVPSVRF